MPDLDKRRVAPAQPRPLPAAKAAAAQKLRGIIRGLRVEHDNLRQSPKHISSTAGFLSGPNGEGLGIAAAAARAQPANDRHRAIRAFLNEHAPLFGHGAEALDRARLTRDFVARNNGLRTAVWEQRLDDIAVYEGVLVGHITRQGELASLSSQFVSEPERAADAGTPNRAALQAAPVISGAQAVWLAAESLEEQLELAAIVPLSARPQGNEQRQSFKAGALPGEAQARLTWLPMNESSLSLCWQIELTRRAGGERYRVLLDARTGEVQVRRRLTVYLSDATFRVFTTDSPTPLSPGWPAPNPNQPPAVNRSLVTLSALNTNASPIGWISDGENETRGNNVDAHTDRNADDVADLPRPQGLPFRVFDAPLDLSQEPAAYSDAAAVQLFYWCNWVHDRLYELGFDEASGNYQKDNFGRGGLGNDAIQADAQDGSGFNNANFTPTADGTPGRIQMFIFNGPSPAIDGDFDAEVILHEYTHGLSTRLVGGGVGIGTLQAAGMGEGWSDFYALALLSEPGDDVDASYAFGAYVSYQLAGLAENYYFGIRRYPYSTDLSKNPLTFKDIDPAQISAHPGVPRNPIFSFNPLNAAEVHAQGEVWCVMLWEARANLIRKHGYATGNQLILQLVTDGMKLSPPNPTFTQARDAIILADQVNNQGANYGELWAAFTKRGLGFSASAPDSTVTTGIVEAYDLPDALFLTNPRSFVSGGPQGGPLTPSCQAYPLTNISEQPISWTARATASWLTVSPGSGTLGPGAATNVLVCLNSNALALPLGSFFDTITFSNTVSRVAQTRSAEVRIVTFTSMPFADDFESGRIQPHWSVSGTPGQQTQVTALHNPHGGNNHLTLDSTGGIKARNELTLGIDLAGYTNVVLRFWAKSFGDEPDGPPPTPFHVAADFDGVAISEEGITWYEVQSLRSVPPTYTEYAVDLDAAAATYGLRYNPTFRIRFNHVDDFQIPFDGLALDDISITGTGARRIEVSVPAVATEGDGPLSEEGRVQLGSPAPRPIIVTLHSSDPGKVAVPPALNIPAGSDQAAFRLSVPDNALLDGSRRVTIRAEATDYVGGSASLDVLDNETAVLKVKLPPHAREGSIPMRKQGTLQASHRPAADVVVQLRSSHPQELQVPDSVILPAGETRAEFDLMPVDDQRIDGPRTVTVTAHVENWTDGRDSMVILDNEEPALRVVLPAAASEGNGVLTNAGAVRLSGTLPTNLVVKLSSSDRSELHVPPTAEIKAGEQEARFDLNVKDDALVDGRQRVFVSAWATGFEPDCAAMDILDDETPPTPLQPRPSDGATNVPISLTLSWNPGLGDVLVNGGFETGDFTGWVTENSGFGAWVINDGTFDPDGPEGSNAPARGQFNAMTAQIGGGQHLLYQDVFIPMDVLGATLSWWDRIRNHTPYFTENQIFRVEVRDTNQAVLATAFTTQLGDPLLTDWQQREFDLSPFRGRTIRIAFFEQDNLGYLNIFLDDVQVRLTEAGTPTTYDVYFGTQSTPGAAEFRGNVTNAAWTPPSLALNTTYYWQILARRGTAQTPGPVWKFTTRGVGPVHRFEWGRIASPQFVDQRFPVTITARDDINNTVKDFNGSVTLLGLPGSGTRSSIVITELDVGANDRVEFANVTDSIVDLSGWTITVYDVQWWPAPLATITVPNGVACAPGRIFQLNDTTQPPGPFPNLNIGTNINWGTSAIGNPIAVLLRDAAGNVVDFVCAGNSDPALITSPTRIPPEEWSGLPVVAALPLAAVTLQRTGGGDHHDAADWTVAAGTMGALNPSLSLPFAPGRLIPVTPSIITNFVTGVWTGFLTVSEVVPRLTLRAEDAFHRAGVANEIAVGARDDLGVSVADLPDLVMVGNELDYRIVVTNSGPTRATGVVLTNLLPPEVNFVSSATFNGACSNAGRLVVCALDNLFTGDSARITIRARTFAPGLLTNFASVTRAEPDGFGSNNSAFAITTVAGPWISTTNNLLLTEGNRVTNIARIPVRLSASCPLPVSVEFATSNFTAEAGQDFIGTNGVLVFEPGVTSLFVNIPIVGDLLDEGFDTFFVTLSSPTNGTVAGPPARLLILDDDAVPSFVLSDASVTEGPPGATNFAEFTIRLTVPSGLPVGIVFSTANRSATAPSDYLTTFGNLGFAPGVTSHVIRVPVLGDNRFEPTETFAVVVSNAFGAILPRTELIGTIRDDDDTELDHFAWNAVPSPQFVDRPFVATLTARDGLNRPATSFNGTVTLRGAANSREIAVGTGTNTWAFPLGTLYHDARTQVIYLPEELGGPGRISALALPVAVIPGQTLTNWTIRLQHTAMTRYVLAAWESEGWTTVYRNDEMILSPGWITFLFTTPFDYDGVSSLLVDFSFNNAIYSVDGLVRSTATAQRRAVFFQTDSAFGNPLDWTGATAPPPQVLERIPNVRFIEETPVAIVPDGTLQLTAGIWTGPITVREPGTNIFLRANDQAGHIANSDVFAVETSSDVDGDGMPDAWELRYFGSTDAGPHQDADGDGMDNLEEFRTGTDPTAAGSVAVIQSVQRRGTDLVIRFTSVGGKAYRLERATNFASALWMPVMADLPGTGEVMEVVDPGAAAGPTCFYRLRIAP